MNPLRSTHISRRHILAMAGLSLFSTLMKLSPFRRLLAQELGLPRVYLHTFDPQTTVVSDAVRSALDTVTNFSWLAQGDSVFIKVASNSNRQPPSVTSPAVLEPVIQRLREAGAGTIYVGDMSGAYFVRHLPDQTIGSTRENMRQNGLLQATEDAGAVIHCFEEIPFESAYIPGIPPNPHHWGEDLQVAEILDRVDHIINLPRLGSHVLAGYTLGLKNAIGWVSDHSRMVLHRDADTFHEKIAEVNAIPQLREKMRLTLTLVDYALTTYGPDAGYPLALQYPFILASEDVVSHDQIALLMLLWTRTQTPAAALEEDPYPEQSNGFNWAFVRSTWGADAAADYHDLPTFDHLAAAEIDTHINYAYRILHGGRPDQIEVALSGSTPEASLVVMLTSRPELGITLVESVSN